MLVLAVLVIVIIAALVVAGASLLANHRRFDEVDRFHHARRLTTQWARAGVTRPLIAEQADGRDEDQPVDRAEESADSVR
jgi:type II secretory pathway pseudopilin PulG